MLPIRKYTIVMKVKRLCVCLFERTKLCMYQSDLVIFLYITATFTRKATGYFCQTDQKKDMFCQTREVTRDASKFLKYKFLRNKH